MEAGNITDTPRSMVENRKNIIKALVSNSRVHMLTKEHFMRLQQGGILKRVNVFRVCLNFFPSLLWGRLPLFFCQLTLLHGALSPCYTVVG